MRIAGKVTMVSVALVAAATLSACANSEQPSAGNLNITSTTPPPPTKTSPKATSTTAQGSTATGPECTADDVKVEGEFGAKPKITIPATCQPPKKLVSKDLKPGTGAEVKAGSTATVFYQLITWSDNKEVDGNFGDQPFPVQNVGQARVITGWNEGLIGLKANGRRLLIIPPDKAYGDGGQGIKPNETLVFVIDAQQVS
ncbi:FKBP-type peptidyl-prolyl cis-trans isomerase [Kibdelosporangium phytohabitans]|uniref:Peptidyl-prolyl cis-trans isomerase n=1 Tax=Kibdelosporangium phytohabitans TaxID=860235 RepID=A0A0N9HVY4_9PSEU|nr:FKBP-type peptidyl-prolyl cis-trans isomerase [Kibdelosporangium phytohabitans]ALG11605.1 hypothetical protein AOZ06_36275 [Kibdelosporangium phytohabitans]MBE1462978.1 peptidylprolyl isomerase [Kibdelosporangium phytohabitans]